MGELGRARQEGQGAAVCAYESARKREWEHGWCILMPKMASITVGLTETDFLFNYSCLLGIGLHY